MVTGYEQLPGVRPQVSQWSDTAGQGCQSESSWLAGLEKSWVASSHVTLPRVLLPASRQASPTQQQCTPTAVHPNSSVPQQQCTLAWQGISSSRVKPQEATWGSLSMAARSVPSGVNDPMCIS